MTESETRREFIKGGLLVGAGVALKILYDKLPTGTSVPVREATPTPALSPTAIAAKPRVEAAPSLSACVTVQPGEGLIAASSRVATGKGPIAGISVRGADGKVNSYPMTQVEAGDVQIIHPGDQVCVDQQPITAVLRPTAPALISGRRNQNPTIFNQTEYREGNEICGPTTLGSIFTTYGREGQTPDVLREEMRRKGLYAPTLGTVFRDSSRADDVVRWLQREKKTSVKKVLDVDGNGNMPEITPSQLRELQRYIEADEALLASGMITLPEFTAPVDHIVWINEVKPEDANPIKVVDPWLGRHDWQKKNFFSPLFYIYALKPQ